MTAPKTQDLFNAVLNLSHYHREHEKFYAQRPLAPRARDPAGLARSQGACGPLERD
jgi:hypothetical protein